VIIPQDITTLDLREIAVLSDIIHVAHSDALCTATWLEILRMMGSIVDCDIGGAVFANTQTGSLDDRITVGVGADLRRWYDAHYPAFAMIADTAQTRGLIIWRPTDVIGREEWEASEIRNDLLKDFALSEPIYIACGTAAQISARFWLARNSSKGDFTRRDIDILKILQPHFCDALRIGKTLLEGNSFRQAFGQAMPPKFICDALGKITEMSAAARQLVDDTDGKFRDVLAQIEAVSCGMIARSADCELVELSGQRYRFMMSPIMSANATMAYVLLVDSANYLRRMLRRSMKACDFSKREVEVCTLLVEGMSNQQIAEKLFVAEATIKDHMATIFEKLGVSSRTSVLPRLLGF
jgi:DNA-binding CsgD family transcriptional regulator